MRKKIERFKELWAVPKYKIYIKFGFWFIFFVFVYLFIFFGNKAEMERKNNLNNNQNNQSETINFTKMKKNLANDSLKVKYNLNDYYIEGIINDNILSGTLEYNDIIYKIKYDGDKLYQVKKDEEILEEELLKEYNLSYLLPRNIVNIFDSTDISASKSADETIYSYNIENIAYSAYLDEESINKIIILDNNVTYELNYEKIGDNNG